MIILMTFLSSENHLTEDMDRAVKMFSRSLTEREASEENSSSWVRLPLTQQDPATAFFLKS